MNDLETKVSCRVCGREFAEARTVVMRGNLPCTVCGFPYNGTSSKETVMCGCGDHMLYLQDAARYNNKWWSLRCLFHKVDRRMPRIVQKFSAMEKQIKEMEKEVSAYRKMRLKFTKMKKLLKVTPCSTCGHPSGNRFTICNMEIMCGSCSGLNEPF